MAIVVSEVTDEEVVGDEREPLGEGGGSGPDTRNGPPFLIISTCL